MNSVDGYKGNKTGNEMSGCEWVQVIKEGLSKEHLGAEVKGEKAVIR